MSDQDILSNIAFNIMDFNHPKINNERKHINNFNNALYVKRDNIEINIEINMINNISINKNVIEGVDNYDSFMNHLNTNGAVVITIYEGIVSNSEDQYIHSYTNVNCNYVPSDDNYLYFNVIKMIPFYKRIK